MTKTEAVYNIIQRLPLLSDKVVNDLSIMIDSLVEQSSTFSPSEEKIIDQSFGDYKNGDDTTFHNAMKNIKDQISSNN